MFVNSFIFVLKSIIYLAIVASLVAQMVKRLLTMWETWVQSLDWEDILEKEMKPTPVYLPGKSHGWRSLVGSDPWGHKESDKIEELHSI